MKNFTNNFTQFTSRLSARWLIMALMLLLGTSSAWAVGINSLNIGYNDGSDKWVTNVNNNGTIALGSIKSAPKLIGINAYTTKYNGGNICSAQVSVENTTYNPNSTNWSYNGNSNDQDFWFSINRTLSSTEGDHSVEVTVTAKGGSNSSSCATSYTYKFKITYTIPSSTATAYSLGGYINKSDVNSYSDTYKLTKQSDGTYKRTISFTQVHNNAQYLWIIDDLGNKWGVSSDTDLTTGNSITLTKGVQSGKVKAIGVINKDYVFIFNPSNGELSYLASCSTPNFSVSLSKSEVAVGCTGVTASITGNDSPTVTWSSTNTSVATINNSTGAITINAAGTTTIKATTTEDGGFCGGVEKPATLTVKSPITSVSLTHVKNQAGDPYSDQELANLIYCAGETVWFKLEQDGSKFQDFQWISYPGTDLVGMYAAGTFSLTITDSGNVGIRLRNDANVDGEGNPTWVESNLLGFRTHPEPTAPYISINPASGVICQGSSATITVENPSIDCSYKLVEDADFTPYTSGDLTYTVQDVAKYYVVAQHKACTNNEYTSNQVAINQIIRTNATISIDPDDPETTPWEPVTITVNPQEGYVYELSYTGNNLAGVDGVIIKQNGDSYTYYIPRPWGTGDATPVRTAVEYGIKAQLKVDGEASQCDLNYATATIQLKDEDNEDCNQ